MKCPYCNKTMEKGIIPGDRYSLKWVPEEKNKGPMNQWFSKGIKLSNPLYEHGVESYYCSSCKKIVIDVKDEKKEYRV